MVFHLYEILKQVKLISTKRRQVSSGLGWSGLRRKVITIESSRKLSGIMKILYILTGLAIIKTHQTIQLKWMHFIAY